MLVMIVIIVLTSIIAAFVLSMKVETQLAQVSDYDSQLEWMGRSGVELARYALTMKCAGQEGVDSLNQFWAGGATPCTNDNPPFSLKDYPLGNGTISITITDMERKWDINNLADPAAPKLDVLQKPVMKAGATDPTKPPPSWIPSSIGEVPTPILISTAPNPNTTRAWILPITANAGRLTTSPNCSSSRA